LDTLHDTEIAMKVQPSAHAAIAAHRFGLGEPKLGAIGDDPRGWLAAQIGPADPQRDPSGPAPADAAESFRRHAEVVRQQRQARRRTAQPARGVETDTATARPSPSVDREGDVRRRREAQPVDSGLRQLVQADLRARLATAARTPRPFAERLALFWANHFTVSAAKNNLRGIVGAFEREAIRPHIAGRFEDLLRAAVRHPAMLRYLDNERSAGPRSLAVQRGLRRAREAGEEQAPRITGLNENVAREVLELHTLGAAAARGGIYTQSDVTAFAAVLTGWRVPAETYLDDRRPAAPGAERRRARDTIAPLGDASPTRFDPAWHEPGAKIVLGHRIAEGAEGLDRVLAMLAAHEATARHVATRLARHFVADDPPPAIVDQLYGAYRRSDGDLPTVYRALLDAPLAWSPTPTKLKSPEEFVISTARVLGLGERLFERQADGGASTLGQRVQAAPSPAGWPDAAAEWLGPEAVWKRVEWATRVAERAGRGIDARALAADALGPLLRDDTARQIERAADGAQALALLLLAPEFQRR
jgi:uncharacterized protein (DUF1800 family)